MVNMKRILSVLLTVCMLLGMTSVSLAEAAAPADETREANTLVIGYTPFNGKFSPFYGETAYDVDVVDKFTGTNLMQTDRLGGIIYNAIEGETVPYNGTDYTYTGIADIKVERDEANDTTTYTAKLREGVLFSDGTPLTADDLIFTYYVLLDPAYTGVNTLRSYNIVGLKNYMNNNSAAEGVQISDADVAAAMAAPSDELKAWINETIIVPVLTSELEWVRSLYGQADYKSYTDAFPVVKDLFANFYGKEGYDSSAVEDEAQVLADVIASYDGDYIGLGAAYAGDEAYYAADVNAKISDDMLNAALATAGGEEVPNITGIQKLDDYTVSVTLNSFEAPAIYQIFGIVVAPMHYYGDKAQYDYDNNQFGHPRGDLSMVEAKTSTPMGMGPYKFVGYENKVVYLEANENYWRGEPKIKSIQLKETLEPDKVTGLTTGTLDISEPSFTADVIKMVKEANGGELTGDSIKSVMTDFLGYGYIGLNAQNISVGGDAASDASKNLRRALMTAMALYRDVVIDSYYGEIASVINYPISNTSWAAPQKTDADYKVAFSVDVDGNDIYTADMTAEQKDEAALKAIVGYLKAAGYTFDEATGLATAAPEGAALEYEALIGGDGTGDHPSFGILTDAKALLAKAGITLTINDMSDFSILQDRVKSGKAAIWCMAWGATIDPDMHQVYHSSNVIGAGGTDSNSYMLADSELDQLIMDARNSADQSYRKATYKAALDRVIDWAVELPTYQRQECRIFSAERIKAETVAIDITTFWNYLYEIEKMEMK